MHDVGKRIASSGLVGLPLPPALSYPLFAVLGAAATAAGVRVYSPADFRLGIGVPLACTLTGLTFSFFVSERAPATRAVEPRQS